ncbi:unnamed protein product [Caenorhabditis auriculariae]|uniref:C2H2-type domain-containing protein n=1 Tax=Caenorhabditis auriculariae TaxID=2777116 RepID=A0A8S1HCR2_9PELO|nr:unnamed protein product [Caenorhabditis auriculariae]
MFRNEIGGDAVQRTFSSGCGCSSKEHRLRRGTCDGEQERCTMSHFEEQKGGWPPQHSLAHLPTHTPIQPHQPEGSPVAFHAMQQGAWRVPVPPNFGTLHKPLFGGDWQGAWGANNNEKLGSWDKWQSAQVSGDVARPLPKFGSASITAAMMNPMQSTAESSETPISSSANYVSPKEEESNEREHHTNSYDVSASQSPSEVDDDRRGERTSEEPIDVECTASNDDNSEESTPTSAKPEKEKEADDVMDTTGNESNNGIGGLPQRDVDAATRLLLNFSQNSFTSALDAARTISPLVKEESSPEKKFLGFSQSNSSAFSNIEPTSSESPLKTPTVIETVPRLPAESGNTPNLSAVLSTPSGAFTRPPGLGPVIVPPPTNGQAAPLVCPICGFACPSKFHYNSHMNTHGDHQCTMCDYTSRTEGRLKKHMRESHTVEEQLKAGLEIEPSQAATTSTPTSSATAIITSIPLGTPQPVPQTQTVSSDTSNLSTTMASLVDAANFAATMANAQSDMPHILTNALSLDLEGTPNLLNSLQSGGLAPSALDQIRAITENPSLLSENGLSLASALGAVSDVIHGDSTKSPDKASNSEPRRNSNGKVKILKCKQCGHQSLSKDEQWAHARTHIPNEKQLNCTHCNFVTEYKHHLEYHYRNHIGSKPFQCKKCAYTCVNKSMLNSHMKSHTNHYQFRCMDCTYATKYCHSLKLHLKKYNHRRVPEGIEGGDTSPTQLRPEIPSFPAFGSLKMEPPTPSTSIAHSLALGPIVTSQSLSYASQVLLRQHQMEGGLNPLLGLNALPPTPPKCPMCDVQCATQEEQIRHNMSHFINQNMPMVSLYSGLSQIPSVIASVASMVERHSVKSEETIDASMDDNFDGDVDEQDIEPDIEHEQEADEGQEAGRSADDEMEHSSICADSPVSSSKGSLESEEQQKRKAFKLEQISQRLQGKSPSSVDSEEKDDSHGESSISPSEPLSNSSQMLPLVQMPSVADTLVVPPQPMISTSEGHPTINSILQQAAACMAFNVFQAKRDQESFRFQCVHCRIAFYDQALYHIHMGYHGYEHPFKCNRCGFIAADPLNFNLHLFQSAHD